MPLPDRVLVGKPLIPATVPPPATKAPRRAALALRAVVPLGVALALGAVVLRREVPHLVAVSIPRAVWALGTGQPARAAASLGEVSALGSLPALGAMLTPGAVPRPARVIPGVVILGIVLILRTCWPR